MNKLEAEYARTLEKWKGDGTILWWGYEALKFRLADRTFYTPDFIVMFPDGEIQAHEVKGFWEDDARVKIKVAAETFPMTFYALRKVRGNWACEKFGGSE